MICASSVVGVQQRVQRMQAECHPIRAVSAARGSHTRQARRPGVIWRKPSGSAPAVRACPFVQPSSGSDGDWRYCVCLIAIATIVERGPMGRSCAATSCLCTGWVGSGRVALPLSRHQANPRGRRLSLAEGKRALPAFRAKRVACAACRDARSRLESRTSESRLCRGECRTWRDLESPPCSSSEGSKRPSAEMRAFTRIWAWRFRLLVVRCRGRHHRRCARGAGWQGVRRLRGAPAPSGWRGRTNSR